jgi:hypothetical protein
MGILSIIGTGLKLAWALVTGRNAQAERDNTPEMQANAAGKRDAAEADAASAVVKDSLTTGDLDQLRKDAAE